MLRSYRYVFVILAALAPLIALAIATDAFLVYQKRETMRQEVIGRVRPLMTAVDTAPAPSGLLSTSASPARPVAFVITSSGATTPVTDHPNFGSGSSIECPPD